ncbi:MAG: hypothetical protein K6T73_08170 [Candidatus Bathyarchaeota archaeon]|nr:hypothetical protein [Candidatus Bathyarchaeota archaeon]
METFKIDRGVITEAGIFFPPGCHGLVYAKLFFQAHQILPRNQESWCHGNNGWWREDAEMPVDSSPQTCKVVAWADGTSYNHTITVCVEVSPFSYIPRWDEVVGAISALLDLLSVEESEASE